MRLLAPVAVPLTASARCLWRGHGSERREQAEGCGQLISSNAVRQLRCLSSPLVTVVGLGDGDRFHNCSCSPTFPHIYTHMRSQRALDRLRCLVALKYKMTLTNSNIFGGSVSLCSFLSLIFASHLLPRAAHLSMSDLHPGKKQPAVCRHDNQPDHLDKQPQPAGL